MTAPALQPGQHLELEISDIAFGGDGIGRVEGFVVFVPFVLGGERVEVEIVEVKRRYATADLVRVITPAPQRVAPRCPYYQQCAGCQYQHVDYPHQLELKHKQIRDIFQRIGGLADPPIAPVVASPRPYGYRNKLVVHGPGKPGFWTTRGRSIIGIDQCPIARAEINAKLAEVSRQFMDTPAHVTLRSNSAGQVWCFTEPGRRTGSLGGTASSRSVPETVLAAADREDAVPPNDRNGAGTATGQEASLADSITEEVLGKTLVVPVRSFFQINQEVIALAIEHARRIFSASGCDRLVDAYCGVGMFTLLLADLAAHCYGIEVDAAAITAANANAKRLGLANTDFYVGKTERLLFYTLRQCPLDKTCLILDPPRSGCGRAVLKTLREQRPHKIVYISCAPPMLARDVKELVKNGYALERVTPFDMFPQTQHCEALAELRPVG